MQISLTGGTLLANNSGKLYHVISHMFSDTFMSQHSIALIVLNALWHLKITYHLHETLP